MNIMEETIKNAMDRLDRNMSEQDQHSPITFEDFLKELVSNPSTVIRNVFQVFHDMMKHYVSEGFDEYPNDPASLNLVHYDCHRLLADGADHPFFADRLFANRLIAQVEALRRGAQQNKIYIFDLTF